MREDRPPQVTRERRPKLWNFIIALRHDVEGISGDFGWIRGLTDRGRLRAKRHPGESDDAKGHAGQKTRNRATLEPDPPSWAGTQDKCLGIQFGSSDRIFDRLGGLPLLGRLLSFLRVRNLAHFPLRDLESPIAGATRVIRTTS